MFLYSKWGALKLSVRYAIADAFGIEKKGPTEVFANTVKSDGFLIEDIEKALTKQALQKYLHTTKSDLAVLFDMMVNKVQGIEEPEEEPVEKPIDVVEPIVAKKKHVE